MYAWGRSRTNERKHPEIAWAADTHYLSYLAATPDDQPVFSSPWQMLRECQRVHRACALADLSACLCREGKEFYACKQMQITASHYLENFLASHNGKLNQSQKKKLNNFKTLLQHFCPKNVLQTAACWIYSVWNHLSRSLAAVFSLQSGCPGSANLWVPQPCWALLPRKTTFASWNLRSWFHWHTLRHSVPTSCWLQTCPANPPQHHR